MPLEYSSVKLTKGWFAKNQMTYPVNSHKYKRRKGRLARETENGKRGKNPQMSCSISFTKLRRKRE